MLDQTHCYTQEKFGRARETLDVGEKAPKAKGFDVHNKKIHLRFGGRYLFIGSFSKIKWFSDHAFSCIHLLIVGIQKLSS